jgi:hypothetical protein
MILVRIGESSVQRFNEQKKWSSVRMPNTIEKKPEGDTNNNFTYDAGYPEGQ